MANWKLNKRLYNIWRNMKSRCLNEKFNTFERYGGRGINVCDEWLRYDKFYEWALRNGYSDNLTIDRIDNNANYCPENCRWVDMKTQCNNTSKNHTICFNNEIHTLSEWAEKLNINKNTLRRRIHLGWNEIKALTTLVKFRRR